MDNPGFMAISFGGDVAIHVYFTAELNAIEKTGLRFESNLLPEGINKRIESFSSILLNFIP